MNEPTGQPAARNGRADADAAGREESNLLAAVRSLHAAAGLADLHARLATLLKVHLGCPAWSVLVRGEADGFFALRASTRTDLVASAPIVAAADQEPLRGPLAEGTGVLLDARAPVVLEWQGKPVPLVACYALPWNGEVMGLLACHEFGPAGPRKGEAQTHRWLTVLAEHLAVAEVQLRALDEARAGAEVGTLKLTAVAEVARLVKQLDPKALVPALLDILIRVCRAQGGAMYLEHEDKLCGEVDRGIVDARVASVLLLTRHPLLHECAETQRTYFLPDARRHPKIDPASVPPGIASLLVMPLVVGGKPVGVVALATDEKHGPLAGAAVEVVAAVAETAATLIQGATMHRQTVAAEFQKLEYDLAGKIQRSLLPGRALQIGGCTVDAWSQNCEGGGGDYYDFAKLGERRLGIAIGDVSGHGIQVAVLLTGVRGFLRARAGVVTDPAELLSQVNDYVKQDVKLGMIMSLFYGILDLEAGTLTFASAGHDPPALLRRASGRFEEPDRRGPALGMLSGARFTGDVITGIAAGDVLMQFTDGVWEQHDTKGRQLGRPRLLEAVREHGRLSATELIHALRGLHQGHRGTMPQEDDMTIVAATIRTVG